ncbi:secondary thiamine-phosphate synthase enzyme YjbQ [Fibrobacterota bacterium]
MSWIQKDIHLQPRNRGCHLVTSEILDQLPELAEFRVGILHLFILHTSASLTINENADPDVRRDLNAHLNVLAPENAPHYLHTLEGPDDMPAHIKASLLGASISVPISRGRLKTGLWQGVYLCEHRRAGSGRSLTATVFGERSEE